MSTLSAYMFTNSGHCVFSNIGQAEADLSEVAVNLERLLNQPKLTASQIKDFAAANAAVNTALNKLRKHMEFA